MTAIEHRPNLPGLSASEVEPQSPFDTHRVENQPPALENYNAFTSDVALREAVSREGGAWGFDRLTRFGAVGGSAQVIAWGFQANRNPPVLRTHDRFGHRIDEVEFHPSWHELMKIGVEHETHALAWRTPKNGATSCGPHSDSCNISRRQASAARSR